MSFTFTVSSLSAIRILDLAGLAVSLGKNPRESVLTYSPDQAEPFYRRSSPDQVRAWWSETQSRYADQLKENVTWDEDSTVELVCNLYSGQALELDTLAAQLDQQGENDLVRRFETLPRDKHGFAMDTLTAAGRRGFAARFPQLSTAPTFYLPFRANLVLQVPDWRGEQAEFGSLPSLVAELAAILGIVEREAPEMARLGGRDDPDLPRLAGAYNAGRIKLDLARRGLAMNLPFWFSE